MMARIVLLTDQPVLGMGFATVIAPVPTFDLIAIYAQPDELLQSIEVSRPDLVLVDKSQHITLEWLIQLRRYLAPGCRAVLWVDSISPEIAYQTMRIGVRGILRKTLSADTLVRCLESVAAGECWFEEELTTSFLDWTTITLTPRETELISLVSQGLRNKEIAGRLALSEPTVKVYLSRLFRKIGVTDRVELALYGLKNVISDQTTLCRSLPTGLPNSAVLMLQRPAPAPETPRREPTNVSAVKAIPAGFRARPVHLPSGPRPAPSRPALPLAAAANFR